MTTAARTPNKPVPSSGKAAAARAGLEIPRKMYHLVGAPITLLLYQLRVPTLPIALALLSVGVLMLSIDIARLYVFPSLNAPFIRACGSLLREQEYSSIQGTVWYMIGCSLTVLLFDRDLATVAICFLSVGDPAASVGGRLLSPLLGIRWMQHSKKTIGGSVAAFVTLLVFSLWWFPGSLLLAVSAALCGMLAELVNDVPPLYGVVDDNLTMPLVGAVLLQILTRS